jgi:hypothetical protein
MSKLHLVFGGRVTDPQTLDFQDPAVVGPLFVVETVERGEVDAETERQLEAAIAEFKRQRAAASATTPRQTAAAR